MASVSVREVSRRFGSRTVLDRVSLNAPAMQVTGLVGPNGAGKTTLLRIVAGILRPSSGQVDRHAGSHVSYFAGERTLPPSVRADRWSWLFDIPDAPRRRIGLLSRGMRQRVGLEAALRSAEPRLIALDEPWEGLDPDGSRWLSEALSLRRRCGCAVMVSSHRIHDLASVCDRCAFLVRGRIAGPVVVCDQRLSLDDRVRLLMQGFDAAKETRP